MASVSWGAGEVEASARQRAAQAIVARLRDDPCPDPKRPGAATTHASGPLAQARQPISYRELGPFAATQHAVFRAEIDGSSPRESRQ